MSPDLIIFLCHLEFPIPYCHAKSRSIYTKRLPTRECANVADRANFAPTSIAGRSSLMRRRPSNVAATYGFTIPMPESLSRMSLCLRNLIRSIHGSRDIGRSRDTMAIRYDGTVAVLTPRKGFRNSEIPTPCMGRISIDSPCGYCYLYYVYTRTLKFFGRELRK